MKRFSTLFLTSLLFASSAFSQPEDKNTQKVVIEVQQKPVAAQATEKPVVEKAHEWVEFGEHVGSAMREGLSALTDEANKFAGTDAGRFTMMVIAWKVAGQDALYLLEKFTGLFVGVPILVIWTSIYIWVLRKRFITHRVVTKREGFWLWAKKEYEIVNKHQLGENEFGAAFVITLVFLGVSAIIFFNAII